MIVIRLQEFSDGIQVDVFDGDCIEVNRFLPGKSWDEISNLIMESVGDALKTAEGKKWKAKS